MLTSPVVTRSVGCPGEGLLSSEEGTVTPSVLAAQLYTSFAAKEADEALRTQVYMLPASLSLCECAASYQGEMRICRLPGWHAT